MAEATTKLVAMWGNRILENWNESKRSRMPFEVLLLCHELLFLTIHWWALQLQPCLGFQANIEEYLSWLHDGPELRIFQIKSFHWHFRKASTATQVTYIAPKTAPTEVRRPVPGLSTCCATVDYCDILADSKQSRSQYLQLEAIPSSQKECW